MKEWQEFAFCAELILLSVSLTEEPIDSIDILTPTDDLSNESFDRRQRYISSFESSDRLIDYFPRMQ
jgi:hypothetical protein